MKIKKFLHAAILVTDLEIADRFYGEILGLTKIDRQLKFPGIWYQVGDYQVHLMLGDQPLRSSPDRQKWGRNPHLAFAVANLTAAKQKLEAQGFPIRLSSSGRPALFTQDPDGNIIEIGEEVQLE
jgi:glyoxylase I family protein